jgi:hypothetical protein
VTGEYGASNRRPARLLDEVNIQVPLTVSGPVHAFVCAARTRARQARMTLAVRAASLADAEAVAAIYKKGIADRSGTFPIDILTNERGGTVTY